MIGRLPDSTARGIGKAVLHTASALRHGPRGDFVWLLRPDDTVISKGVIAGQADGGRVLIERGLGGGRGGDAGQLPAGRQ